MNLIEVILTSYAAGLLVGWYVTWERYRLRDELKRIDDMEKQDG